MGYMKKFLVVNRPLLLQQIVAKVPETFQEAIDVTPILDNAENVAHRFCCSVLSKITCGAARAVTTVNVIRGEWTVLKKSQGVA